MKILHYALLITVIVQAYAFAGVSNYERSNELFYNTDKKWSLSYNLNVTSSDFSRGAGESMDNNNSRPYDLQFYKTYHEVSGELYGYFASRLNINMLTDYMSRAMGIDAKKNLSNTVIGAVYQCNPITIENVPGRQHQFGFAFEYSYNTWKNSKASFVYADPLTSNVNDDYYLNFEHHLLTTSTVPSVSYSYIGHVEENIMVYMSLRAGPWFYTEKQNVPMIIFDDPEVDLYLNPNAPRQYMAVNTNYKCKGYSAGFTAYSDINGLIIFSDLAIMLGDTATTKNPYIQSSVPASTSERVLGNVGVGYRSEHYKIIASIIYDYVEREVISSNNHDMWGYPHHLLVQQYVTSSCNFGISVFF